MFELPDLYYVTPFLGHRMTLAAVAPNNAKWSEASKFFFLSRVLSKRLFAYMYQENTTGKVKKNNALADAKPDLPKSIAVVLKDKDGELGEQMCSKGFARRRGDQPTSKM